MKCPIHRRPLGCQRALARAKNAGQPANLADIPCLFERLKVAIIRLRKGLDVEASWRQFHCDVQENMADVIECANSRWLVSILDTYADFGDAEERRAALLVTLLVTFDRFEATIDGAKPFSRMWDGLWTMGTNGRADAHRNLFRRIGKVMEDTPSIDPLFRMVLTKALQDPRCILNRLNAVSKRDVVKDVRAAVGYLCDTPEVAPEAAPEAAPDVAPESFPEPASTDMPDVPALAAPVASGVWVDPYPHPRLTLITPTGDRQQAFALCQRWMQRQTFQGRVHWIIVDDGQTPTQVTFQRPGWTVAYYRRERQAGEHWHTLAAQMREAMRHLYDDLERVVIIEDDDWYSPGYLSLMDELLDRAELVGIWSNPAYRVAEPPAWRFHPHGRGTPGRTVFAATGATGAALAHLQDMLDADPGQDPSLDRRWWKTFTGSKLLRPIGDPPEMVQIKGLPGRMGFGTPHRSADGLTPDPERTRLARWIGEEDAGLIWLVAQPAVTVIMPCWLRPQRTRRAIESVLRQTCVEWELLLVGDACPELPGVMANISDARVRWHNMPTHEGRWGTQCLNWGLQHARAPYVVFLGNDDYLLPSHLHARVNSIQHTGHGFTYHDAMIGSPAGRIRNSQLRFRHVGGSELIVRTDLAKRVLFKTDRYGHDWDFIDGLLKTGCTHDHHAIATYVVTHNRRGKLPEEDQEID